MEFLSGLNEDFINRCVNLKFNVKDRIFEFYILGFNDCINLEMDKFIECYTEFLKK